MTKDPICGMTVDEATALHAQIENRLRTAGMPKKITVAELLAEMGRIRAIGLPDGTRLLREVSKRQREWLAAVGLPRPKHRYHLRWDFR